MLTVQMMDTNLCLLWLNQISNADLPSNPPSAVPCRMEGILDYILCVVPSKRLLLALFADDSEDQAQICFESLVQRVEAADIFTVNTLQLGRADLWKQAFPGCWIKPQPLRPAYSSSSLENEMNGICRE